MKTLKTCVAMLALAGSAAQAAPLLTNGDFEDGSTGWTFTGNVGVTTGGYGGFYFGAGSAAQNGTRAVAFNSGETTPNGTLSQTFNTVAGTNYLVEFDYGSTNCGPGCGQTVDVQAGNSTFAATGPSGTLLQHFTFVFTALGATTTLQFTDRGSNYTYSLDGVLDNVSVTDVPEPASLALMGLGLAGLALRRRR